MGRFGDDWPEMTPELLNHLHAAAVRGDSDSSRILGTCYLQMENLDEAQRWLEAAARSGDPESAHILGVVFQNDLGDVAGAEGWFRLGASGGNSNCLFALGALCWKADDIEGAKTWWMEAANAGHEKAADNLRAMAAKTKASPAGDSVSDVTVEVDELALSLRGWEVQDFRARVTSAKLRDGDYSHKLSTSGVFRFNEADWADCFSRSREYPRSPAMLLSSPKLSAWPAISGIYLGQPKPGRPARTSVNDYFIHTYSAIDPSDLQIEIAGYDSIDAADGIECIPLRVKELSIELEDETTRPAVKLTFDQLAAFTHFEDGGTRWAGRTHARVRASGRVTFGSPEDLLADWVSTWTREIRQVPTVLSKAPFTRPVPQIVFDILDESGFLLEQVRGEINISIPVDEQGRTPSRNPTWIIDKDLEISSYSAPLSRVIARVEDP